MKRKLFLSLLLILTLSIGGVAYASNGHVTHSGTCENTAEAAYAPIPGPWCVLCDAPTITREIYIINGNEVIFVGFGWFCSICNAFLGYV